MFTITKDGMIATVTNPSSLPMYLNQGWKLVSDDKKEEPQQEVPEPTKKELQAKLDELGVDYKATENKAALLEKVKGAMPDDFDDGLLKG